MWGFKGKFSSLTASKSFLTESKALLKSIVKTGTSLPSGSCVQVAVYPVLCGRKSTGTIATLPVSKLRGRKILFYNLLSMAAIDCFLKHPGYNRSDANAAIVSFIFW